MYDIKQSIIEICDGGKSMGIWAWVQPDKRIWKVVSDHEDGSIRVYDEDGTLILEKEGLSEEALTTVEDNFLDVSATNLDKDKESFYVSMTLFIILFC
jgi:hypothetical protein